ncbi:hypothetical protein GE21DRAFT_1333978 [Neurospora crassa]|nr:hypothetical protein GE21DRAFT_1333978 [Neurospora crassa]
MSGIGASSYAPRSPDLSSLYSSAGPTHQHLQTHAEVLQVPGPKPLSQQTLFSPQHQHHHLQAQSQPHLQPLPTTTTTTTTTTIATQPFGLSANTYQDHRASQYWQNPSQYLPPRSQPDNSFSTNHYSQPQQSERTHRIPFTNNHATGVWNAQQQASQRDLHHLQNQHQYKYNQQQPQQPLQQQAYPQLFSHTQPQEHQQQQRLTRSQAQRPLQPLPSHTSNPNPPPAPEQSNIQAASSVAAQTTNTMPPKRAVAQAAQQPQPSPIQPSLVKTKFPTARIKRIMQADEEVGKVAQQTPIAVGKALELFMVQLVTKSADIARERNSKRVSAQMLKQVVESDDQWDFLREITSKIENDDKEKPAASASGRGRTKAESESEEEAQPEKKGRGGAGRGGGRGRKKSTA